MGEISPIQLSQMKKLFESFNLVAVYLFGSRADGTAYECSDYDFGVLSNESLNVEAKALLVLELEEKLSAILEKEVDIVYLNSASIEMKFWVFKQGIVIYCNNNNKRTDFEDIVIRDYLDFKPFLDLFNKEVREAVLDGGFYG